MGPRRGSGLVGAVDLIQGGLAGAVVTALGACVVMIFVRGLGGVAISPLAMLGVIIVAGLAGGFIQRMIVSAGGEMAGAVVLPSGDTTAYVPTFSHIDALEIRGDLDGAERAWAEACEVQATNALVWVKAGDFHLRLRKDASAALRHYQRVRDLPGAGHELLRYAQAKIVDLHLGPLADEGRALVEMRRLIERFPGTCEADQARAALARLKAERQQG